MGSQSEQSVNPGRPLDIEVRNALLAWTINAEHRLLIQAIKDHDVETAETAESILTMHIRRTRIELSQHPEVFASPTA